MPSLIDAYLEYRSHDSTDGFPPMDPNVAPEERADLPSGSISNIELIDIFGKSSIQMYMRKVANTLQPAAKQLSSLAPLISK
jgi:hypothetical protein